MMNWPQIYRSAIAKQLFTPCTKKKKKTKTNNSNVPVMIFTALYKLYLRTIILHVRNLILQSKSPPCHGWIYEFV